MTLMQHAVEIYDLYHQCKIVFFSVFFRRLTGVLVMYILPMLGGLTRQVVVIAANTL
jgi:hypothetical protein